jgi:DNA-binding transcriptional ArsR family regulator
MVTHAEARTRPVFEAISDPTRRAILDLLTRRERSAGEIAAEFAVSRPAISRHVRVLRRAGLVRERREAQQRLYSLDPTPLREVDRWLERYRLHWGARLHDLKRAVESAHTSKGEPRE